MAPVGRDHDIFGFGGGWLGSVSAERRSLSAQARERDRFRLTTIRPAILPLLVTMTPADMIRPTYVSGLSQFLRSR